MQVEVSFHSVLRSLQAAMWYLLAICFLRVVAMTSSQEDSSEDPILGGLICVHSIPCPFGPSDEPVLGFFDAPSETNFRLHTRENPNDGQLIRLNDHESLRNSSFDPSKTTKVIIHGFLNGHSSDTNLVLTKAYLDNHDVNVLVASWGEGSKVRISLSKLSCNEKSFSTDFVLQLGGSTDSTCRPRRCRISRFHSWRRSKSLERLDNRWTFIGRAHRWLRWKVNEEGKSWHNRWTRSRFVNFSMPLVIAKFISSQLVPVSPSRTKIRACTRTTLNMSSAFIRTGAATDSRSRSAPPTFTPMEVSSNQGAHDWATRATTREPLSCSQSR